MAGSFELSLRKFAAEAKENADKVVRQVVFEVGSRIIYRSPVDTGRFRQNWHYSLNAPDSQVIASTGTSESPAPAPPPPQIAPGLGFGNVHYYQNNLPYAQRLEYGYSNQAPTGMVGITVLEFQSIADQEAKKVNP